MLIDQFVAPADRDGGDIIYLEITPNTHYGDGTLVQPKQHATTKPIFFSRDLYDAIS